MSDLPTPQRRYSEKEVSRLLERASELQRSSPSSSNPTGLTLTELEEIAAEAGLDVALLRRAAREMEHLDPPGSGIGRTLAGGPMKLVLEHTLPFEVPESAYDRLIHLIQAAANSQGQASQVGRTLSFQSQGQNSPISLQVVISTGQERTLIRIEERYGTFAGALFGGGLGGGFGVAVGIGGGVGGAIGSLALVIALPVSILGITYATMRTIFGRKTQSRSRQLHGLMDRLVEELTYAAREEAGD